MVASMAEPERETHTFDHEAVPSGRRASLFVVEETKTSTFALPLAGIVLIGRSPEADVRIDGASVSRKHARITASPEGFTVTDLGSHNGVRVNGARIDGARSITAGDVVTIGEVTLVLRLARDRSARAIADPALLRRRLAEEVDRALDVGRSLGLIVIEGSGLETKADRAAEGLERSDVIGWTDGGELVVIAPELGLDAASATAADLVRMLGDGARAGVAASPGDGCDADTLLSSARAAVATAAEGGVARAAETAIDHVIGDRRVIVADPSMIRLYDLIRKLAASDLPVLVLGETGAGKEHAAAAVHGFSPRAAKPFVSINCAALPESLVESELFGFERGAFSGAITGKMGLFERANGGTVFLDEVGELSSAVQSKLLRALETRHITRLGDTRERAIDLRVVAATNRDLEAEVTAGRFRRDLLYRLSAAIVELPPLRMRPREIGILARRFFADARAKLDRDAASISDAALLKLAGYAWPGNVRELKNAMEYAAATMSGSSVTVADLPARVAGRGDEPSAPLSTPPPAEETAPKTSFRPIAEEIRELERGRMIEALEAAGYVRTRAADLIGMPLRTFVFKCRQYGIEGREARRRA